MSSLVYLAEVIAFFVLVLWTYNMERTGNADTGLFSMRDDDGDGQKPPPRWRRVADGPAKSERPAGAGATPAWRRTPPRDRWAPKD